MGGARITIWVYRTSKKFHANNIKYHQPKTTYAAQNILPPLVSYKFRSSMCSSCYALPPSDDDLTIRWTCRGLEGSHLRLHRCLWLASLEVSEVSEQRAKAKIMVHARRLHRFMGHNSDASRADTKHSHRLSIKEQPCNLLPPIQKKISNNLVQFSTKVNKTFSQRK
jgi:hypothetical protein